MNRLQIVWKYVSLVAIRIVLPIIILFVAGSWVATQLDMRNVRAQPTSDYLEYTSFSVNGAYEGEDINFNVCRNFKQRFKYEGEIAVYVIPDPGVSTETQKTYTRPIGATLNSQPCESKSLREADFHHKPGSYQMSFRVCIRVEYNIEKCTSDVVSNVYRVRPKPEDAKELIKYYQNLIDQLKVQTETQSTQPDPGSLATPPISQQSTNQSSNNNNSNNGNQNPHPQQNRSIIERVTNRVGDLINNIL